MQVPKSDKTDFQRAWFLLHNTCISLISLEKVVLFVYNQLRIYTAYQPSRNGGFSHGFRLLGPLALRVQNVYHNAELPEEDDEE